VHHHLRRRAEAGSGGVVVQHVLRLPPASGRLLRQPRGEALPHTRSPAPCGHPTSLDARRSAPTTNTSPDRRSLSPPGQMAPRGARPASKTHRSPPSSLVIVFVMALGWFTLVSRDGSTVGLTQLPGLGLEPTTLRLAADSAWVTTEDFGLAKPCGVPLDHATSAQWG
jgi:hypothetical protein